MNPWPDRHSAVSNYLKRIAELKNENIKLKLGIYQLEKDSQSVTWEQIDECLATFTPLLECSERILTCGSPVQTHLKNFKDLLVLMSTTLINRPMLQGKGKVAASDAGDCIDSHQAPQGELKSVKPEVPGETQKSSWRSPVVQKSNAGPLNASTPSPLLGVSGSPESVGLRGLEDDVNELALQLEAKLVLSSPVLEEEREEENRTLCSAASPAAPEAGVRELAVRTEDKPRQRCSLTERAGASSTSTSALKGSGRATRNCGWDVKDLTAQLKRTSLTSGFTIDLGAGPSATAKQANTGATTCSTISTLVSELCVESNTPVPPVRAASPAPPVGVPEEAGRLNGLSPRQDRKTGSCCSSSPVFQKSNAGPLNASTPSPLLGVSGSPESVGLRGLEDDVNELALQLEAKLVLSSPVLQEEREEENRTLCSAASPAAPEAGVRELAVRTEDKPRQRCSLTERAGASSTSTSALKGSGRATRNCGWEVKDLTARLKLTSVSASFSIILDAGLSPSTKQQAEAKAAMTLALPAPPEGVPARARGVSSLLSPSGGRAPELEAKPGGQGRTSIPRKDAETERSSSSSPALRGSRRATQTSAWDVKDLKVNFNLPSLSSSFTIDLGAAPSATEGLKAARF